jgi:hypothetical protein
MMRGGEEHRESGKLEGTVGKHKSETGQYLQRAAEAQKKKNETR